MHGSDPEIMYLIGASLVSDWSKKKTLPMALRDLVLFPEKFEFSDEVIEPIEDDVNLELTLDSFENDENESSSNQLIVSSRLCPDLIQDLPIEVDNDVARFHLSLFKT